MRMNPFNSYEDVTEEEYRFLRKASVKTSLQMTESLFGNTRLAEMVRVFSAIAKSLRIDYFVIGGLAFDIWGRTRATLDADIIVIISPDKVLELLNGMSFVGFKGRATDHKKIARGAATKISYADRFSIDLRAASFRIDRAAMSRAIQFNIFGVRVKFATKEDVIVYKLARFDEQDKADIRSIVKRWGKGLDIDYIQKAAGELHEEYDENVLDNLQTILQWIS